MAKFVKKMSAVHLLEKKKKKQFGNLTTEWASLQNYWLHSMKNEQVAILGLHPYIF